MFLQFCLDYKTGLGITAEPGDTPIGVFCLDYKTGLGITRPKKAYRLAKFCLDYKTGLGITSLTQFIYNEQIMQETAKQHRAFSPQKQLLWHLRRRFFGLIWPVIKIGLLPLDIS